MDSVAGGISVVIPLYNHAAYIGRALESVFAQTVAPLEIIVVDDGSTDASVAVVREIAMQRTDVVLWSQPNRGAHQALNAGIYRARGEYVAILNSDDAYHPRRFARCLEILGAADAVCTGLEFIDGAGLSIDNPWYRQARAAYDELGDLALALVNGNFLMTTSNLFLRRAVFDEIGHFSALRYAHDLDFLLRLLMRGRQLRLLDEPLLAYRLHATNTISEGTLKVKVEWAAAVAFFLRQTMERGAAWEYYERFGAIAERHGLMRLIMYFFAFFASVPTDVLTCDAYKRDTNFCEFLDRVVQ